MNDETSPTLSESEALRLLNLPSSQRHRLRRALSHTSAGRSLIYQRTDILNLAKQLHQAAPEFTSPGDAVPQLQTR